MRTGRKKAGKPRITKKTIAARREMLAQLKGLKKVRARAGLRKDQVLLLQKRGKRVMKGYRTLDRVLKKLL